MEEVIYRQPEKRSWEGEGGDESTGKVKTNGGKIQKQRLI